MREDESIVVTERCPERCCVRGIEVTLTGNHLAYSEDFGGIQFPFCPMCGRKFVEVRNDRI
jgi:hypothetical protein